MSGPLSLLIAFVAGVVLLIWFVQAEREGRPTSLIFILGLLVVETVLYGNQGEVPTGLLHPGTQPLTFRFVDEVIAIALLARLIGRGAPIRAGAGPLLWVTFLAWIGSAGIVGFFGGNDVDLVTFEAKAILYVGVFAVAAGVPAQRLLEGRSMLRLVYFSGVVAGVLCLMDVTGVRVGIPLPGIGRTTIGAIDGDTATVLVSIGIIGLALGACSERGRLGLLLASGPLVLSPFLSLQRAAMVTLAIGVFVIVVLTPAAWRRLRTTPTEVALATIVILGLFLSATLFNAAAKGTASEVPLASRLTTALYSPGKQLSAQDRINQLIAVRPLIAEKPLLGWGLGKTYTYWEPGHKKFLVVNITHNILTDVTLRMGLVGLLLFLAALALSMRDGVRAWLRHRNQIGAALALGCTAVVVGLLAKGLVESIFEKYRMATLLGVMLGMMRLLATSAEKTEASYEPASTAS
jgi:O-antigen ligase